MTTPFNLKDMVRTIKGARFKGKIIAFDVDPKNPGCTVMATHPDFLGTKHVYPIKQLEIVSQTEQPSTEELIANLNAQDADMSRGEAEFLNELLASQVDADNSRAVKDGVGESPAFASRMQSLPKGGSSSLPSAAPSEPTSSQQQPAVTMGREAFARRLFNAYGRSFEAGMNWLIAEKKFGLMRPIHFSPIFAPPRKPIGWMLRRWTGSQSRPSQLS